MEFKVRQHVGAPREEVFAAASDFENTPEHISKIERVEMLTPGPVRKGTRFKETRIMFKRECTEEMEVVRFDPPRAYALGAENHGCRYLTTLTFEPSGDGTDVEMHFTATPLTFMAKVLGFVFKPMMKRISQECGQDLKDLARAVEGRAGAPAH